jgi:hypothetical protein
VVAKQCCDLDFMKKGFVCLIAEHFNPVLGYGILSAFLGLSHENHDG